MGIVFSDVLTTFLDNSSWCSDSIRLPYILYTVNPLFQQRTNNQQNIVLT